MKIHHGKGLGQARAMSPHPEELLSLWPPWGPSAAPPLRTQLSDPCFAHPHSRCHGPTVSMRHGLIPPGSWHLLHTSQQAASLAPETIPAWAQLELNEDQSTQMHEV